MNFKQIVIGLILGLISYITIEKDAISYVASLSSANKTIDALYSICEFASLFSIIILSMLAMVFLLTGLSGSKVEK